MVGPDSQAAFPVRGTGSQQSQQRLWHIGMPQCLLTTYEQFYRIPAEFGATHAGHIIASVMITTSGVTGDGAEISFIFREIHGIWRRRPGNGLPWTQDRVCTLQAGSGTVDDRKIRSILADPDRHG